VARFFVFLPVIFISGVPRQEVPAQKVDPFQMALIQKSARQYCQRLEKAALDFVCQEEVSEKIDLTLESSAKAEAQFSVGAFEGVPGLANPSTFRSDHPKNAKSENTFLFDYQFIRQGGRIKETRVLLEKNGKKAGKKEEPPKTETFQYADILLAPVRMLDERFGEYYDYRLLREDEWNGVKAWVLDVVPRLSVVDVYLGGKIWLKQDDSSVLRVDWDPSTFGKYESILLRAKKFESRPDVTSFTEFGCEKNGLRFPSLDQTEETYIRKDGKKFVRAMTKIAYKDYKFFTVETETDFKRS
jgi:hypothetical protein